MIFAWCADSSLKRKVLEHHAWASAGKVPGGSNCWDEIRRVLSSA
jgi:hypothetical protein